MGWGSVEGLAGVGDMKRKLQIATQARSKEDEFDVTGLYLLMGLKLLLLIAHFCGIFYCLIYCLSLVAKL